MTQLVSIIMSAYNAAATLGEALESIIAQSHKDFELILIDDASTDETAAIAASYRDPRIFLTRNQTNVNLAAALNQALRLARGDYIARMDADDVMMKHRLAVQTAFLNTRPDIGVVGSFAENITPSGRTIGINRRPVTPAAIKAASFFTCPMTHPTVMLRRSLVPADGKLYDEDFSRAQDMECWARLVHRTDFLNLEEVLLHYRQQNKKAQKNMKADLRYFRGLIADRNLGFLIEHPSAEDKSFFRSLLGYAVSPPKSVAGLAGRLRALNRATQNYDPALFETELAKRLYKYLAKNWSSENRVLWNDFTEEAHDREHLPSLSLFTPLQSWFKRKK